MKVPMFSEVTSEVTQGIRVSVRSIFLVNESSPMNSHFVFAYQVQIHNGSGKNIQLLSRKWQITDGLGNKRVVEGDGVVGEQPQLEPGKSHEYVSGCDFRTPIGKMEGHYLMKCLDDASTFKVRIPTFVLAAQAILN